MQKKDPTFDNINRLGIVDIDSKEILILIQGLNSNRGHGFSVYHLGCLKRINDQ